MKDVLTHFKYLGNNKISTKNENNEIKYFDLIQSINDFESIKEKIENIKNTLIKDNPELRLGQATYIAAYKLFPSETNKINQNYDCFYLNNKIEDFYKELYRIIMEDNI
jgi:hypothetical protein